MKAYVKPELYFESFELDTHIADCIDPTNPTGSDWTCLPTDPSNPFSVEDSLMSVDDFVADQQKQQHCYYAPNEFNYGS